MRKRTRHFLGLSGGKDSSALAVYMRDREPEMEYFFTDTGKELPETYEYLDKLEIFLGKRIVRLNVERDFDHWLTLHGGMLPSSQVRWCTLKLKIRPFEKYVEEHVGNNEVYHYIAIRADEDRVGYKPLKTASLRNIIPKYPFKEDGKTKEDVYRILEDEGPGLPDYYKWRTRSGCYFCFFQRKSEWVGLLEQHPELFELAKEYEKFNTETGERFTWSQGESLEELSRPERIAQIKASTEQAKASKKNEKPNRRLIEILTDLHDDEDDEEPCLICHK